MRLSHKDRMHWNPAASIIRKLGGVNATAAIAQLSVTRVVRWRLDKARGGTGGEIPHRCIRLIHEHARANGLDISAEDFLAAPSIVEEEQDAASHASAAPTEGAAA